MQILEIDTEDEIDTSSPFVVFGEAEQYPYQLMCLGLDSDQLIADYPTFLSNFSVLIETGLFDRFCEKLDEDGYRIYFFKSGKRVLRKHQEWSEPLLVEGLNLPDRGHTKGALFPYQMYAIRKGLDADLDTKFLFANHGTGTGKSVTACAGAQELFNRGMIDVVFFFTLRKNKINMMRAFNNFTQLRAVNIEGTKAKRTKEFAKQDADVYVMNYEKANFDQKILQDRIAGKRVFFIFDEVQKILIHKSGKPNLAGQGIASLIETAGKQPYMNVWPMSATVINADPERYFYLYSHAPGKHPLKNITTYRKRFTERTEMNRTPWGSIDIKYIWDPQKLEEVRHIVAPWTHTVRKTDPGVREYFKDTKFEPVYIQLSDEDRELYELVKQAGSEDDEKLWGQYYRVLNYICNTAGSLKYSQSEIAKTIVESVPDLSSKTSSKMETLVEQVQSIKDQGDKSVVFTQYTNLGLFLIAEELENAGIKHVVHYGTGMTDKQAQMAQDEFKSDPSVTAFLSSDAGSHGLSFQEARYVINFDCPYSYDLLTQRNDRIDRADSYLDGLTSYVYICEDTVEERRWLINNERRSLAAATQGTIEQYSRSSSSEEANLEYLIFG